jgi:outer membrane protein assembly factor BamB
VPNDFKDYDMQLSPIAADVGGVDAVIGGGKMGDVFAMNAATGALLWKTPVGVHDGRVFTTLYNGELIALNRSTGAIVYRKALPDSTNSPIAVAGNTVLVPAGGPATSAKGGSGSPQLVAYTLP